jgi:hypothetical protein
MRPREDIEAVMIEHGVAAILSRFILRKIRRLRVLSRSAS